MVVMGVDPGYAIVGWGAVAYKSNTYKPLGFGSITTDADTDFNKRLQIIYDEIYNLLDRCRPDAMAIERLYFTTNQKTVIQVAQARGVILLAASMNGIPVYEYTPLQIKQSVTGYGKAIKTQVQDMTKRILRLEKVPKPDDTADALAVAICHAYSFRSKLFTQIGKTL